MVESYYNLLGTVLTQSPLRTGVSRRELWIGTFLFFYPILISYQPFFVKEIQFLIINIRLLGGPILILLFLRYEFDILLLLASVTYFFTLSLFFPPANTQQLFLTSVSIFASITYFKLGYFLQEVNIDRKIYVYLAYGVTAVNVSTFILYYLMGNGYISMELIFEIIQRNPINNLFRFSLGNSIELPLTLSCLLYAAVVLNKKRNNFLFPTLINLLAALLAQSRIVIIIASILFFREFISSNKKSKVIFYVLLIALVPYVIEEFNTQLEIFLDRVSGRDDGSAQDRSNILNNFINNVGISIIFFGRGLTSSFGFMVQYLGEWRSIESAFLQLIYELGLIGTFLFFMNCIFKKDKIHVPNNDIILYLSYVQVLFFLPINPLSPTIFLLFGVCSHVVHIKHTNYIL